VSQNWGTVAVILLMFAAVCFTRAIRGTFRPGMGYYPKTEIQLETTGRRVYAGIGTVLTAVGIWMLAR
jgi:hypothetical protein